MKAHRRLIAALGLVVFLWSLNAFLHQRDTNATGAFLKVPLDLYENCKNKVIIAGLFTICPLAVVVNHVGWLIAKRSRTKPRLHRIATLDEFKPEADEPESFVYAAVFFVIYHLIPWIVIVHLFARFFIEAPPDTLWDFSAAGFFSGTAHRYEGISYYSGWMTPLVVVMFILCLATFVRLVVEILRRKPGKSSSAHPVSAPVVSSPQID